MLALGLVFATVRSVATVGHTVLGLDWGPAFALGAIVSPTNALAATTIMERVRAPRRLVAILSAGQTCIGGVRKIARRLTEGRLRQ